MFNIETNWDDGIGGCLNFGPLDVDFEKIDTIVIEYKDGEKESFPFGDILSMMQGDRPREENP